MFQMDCIPHNEFSHTVKVFGLLLRLGGWLIRYKVERYFQVLKPFLVASSASGVGGEKQTNKMS